MEHHQQPVRVLLLLNLRWVLLQRQLQSTQQYVLRLHSMFLLHQQLLQLLLSR